MNFKSRMLFCLAGLLASSVLGGKYEFTRCLSPDDGKPVYVHQGKTIDFQMKKTLDEICVHGDGLYEGYKPRFLNQSSPEVKKPRKPERTFYCSDGHLNGDFTIWYPDGVKEVTGFFKQGKYDGAWTTYNPDGKPYSVEYFKNGKPVAGDTRP